MDLSHLVEAKEEQETQPLPEDKLEKISLLAQRFSAKKEEVALATATLKAAKAEFNKLAQIELPQAMQEVDMKEFTLGSGKHVSIKEDVSTTVMDYEKLSTFLEARGDDAILKTTIVLGKVPKNVLQAILKTIHEDWGLVCASDTKVHPQTLAAYIRKLCGVGGVCEAELSLAELDATMLKSYLFYKTEIK